ncbi:MAG: hypothetical protein KAS32_10460 [Candidatus Peribacteraceae bacterium]|nr:hypothetical protein [Candidatus Peribacteraceae bacterium]
MVRGRPPSTKTLVDRQLGRNLKHPVLPAGDSYPIPNHSGLHDDLKANRLTVYHEGIFHNSVTLESGVPTLIFDDTHAGHANYRIRVEDDKLCFGAGAPIGEIMCLDLNGKSVTLAKDSGAGIKVDTVTPTYGWRDLLGETTTRNIGATKPSFETYNGAIFQYRFGAGDLEHYDFHIPHDYVAGTNIHLHIHWSQISTTNTGGTLNFKYSALYSKGHNQGAFTGTPITDTFTSADAGTTQYQHHITEVIISGASATAALFDRDDLEPDGVILMTLEMDANNLTDSVGVTDPFIHYVDIHYQSTNIGTKDKAPDFYA